MRSAKEQEFFPYDTKQVCYILVDRSGAVSQVRHSQNELKATYMAASEGTASLYAVWPGQWSSDLFVIDDLNAFADAVGIPREDPHVHEIEWTLSSVDDGRSLYAWVDCKFRCDCSFWKTGIKKFANDMRRQKGWEVAVSKGCGGHGDVFSVPVKRSSLK